MPNPSLDELEEQIGEKDASVGGEEGEEGEEEPGFFRKIYFAMEDSYHGVVDFVNDKLHIPVYKYFVEPLESRGIPSFVVVLLFLLLLFGGLFWYFTRPTSATVSVRLLGPQNSLVGGAEVSLAYGGTLKQALTDESGRAVFQSVPLGAEINVTGVKEGFEPASRKTIVEEDTSITLELSTPGGPAGARVLKVTVRSTDGRAISGAILSYFYANGTQMGYKVSDGAGKADLQNDGRNDLAFLSVDREGYVPKSRLAIYFSAGVFDIILSPTAGGLTPTPTPSANNVELVISVSAGNTTVPMDTTVSLFDNASDSLIATDRSNYGGQASFQVERGRAVYVNADPYSAQDRINYVSYLGKSSSFVVTNSPTYVSIAIPRRTSNDTIVNVKVVDSATNFSIADAQVTAYDAVDKSFVRSASSDAAGSAVLDLGRRITIALTGYKQGYFPGLYAGVTPPANARLPLVRADANNSAKVLAVVKDYDNSSVFNATVRAYYENGFVYALPVLYSNRTGHALADPAPPQAKFTLLAVSGARSGRSSLFTVGGVGSTTVVEIRLEQAFGNVTVSAKDVVVKNNVDAEVRAVDFFSGDLLDSCSTGTASCTLTVPASVKFNLTAGAAGYESATLSQEQLGKTEWRGRDVPVTLFLLPSQYRDKLFLEFLQIEDENGANASIIDKGRAYRAHFKVNFPSSNVTEAALYARIGADGTLDKTKNVSIIGYSGPEGVTPLVSRGTRHDSRSCSSTQSSLVQACYGPEGGATPCKWVQVNFNPATFNAQPFDVFVNLGVGIDAVSNFTLNFRSYAKVADSFLRMPQDFQIPFNNDSCAAQTYSRNFSITSGRTTCNSVACITITYNDALGSHGSDFVTALNSTFDTVVQVIPLADLSPNLALNITSSSHVNFTSAAFDNATYVPAGSKHNAYAIANSGANAAGRGLRAYLGSLAVSTTSHASQAFVKADLVENGNRLTLSATSRLSVIDSSMALNVASSKSELMVSRPNDFLVTVTNLLGEPLNDSIVYVQYSDNNETLAALSNANSGSSYRFNVTPSRKADVLVSARTLYGAYGQKLLPVYHPNEKLGISLSKSALIYRRPNTVYATLTNLLDEILTTARVAVSYNDTGEAIDSLSSANNVTSYKFTITPQRKVYVAFNASIDGFSSQAYVPVSAVEIIPSSLSVCNETSAVSLYNYDSAPISYNVTIPTACASLGGQAPDSAASNATHKVYVNPGGVLQPAVNRTLDVNYGGPGQSCDIALAFNETVPPLVQRVRYSNCGGIPVCETPPCTPKCVLSANPRSGLGPLSPQLVATFFNLTSAQKADIGRESVIVRRCDLSDDGNYITALETGDKVTYSCQYPRVLFPTIKVPKVSLVNNSNPGQEIASCIANVTVLSEYVPDPVDVLVNASGVFVLDGEAEMVMSPLVPIGAVSVAIKNAWSDTAGVRFAIFDQASSYNCFDVYDQAGNSLSASPMLSIPSGETVYATVALGKANVPQCANFTRLLEGVEVGTSVQFINLTFSSGPPAGEHPLDYGKATIIFDQTSGPYALARVFSKATQPNSDEMCAAGRLDNLCLNWDYPATPAWTRPDQRRCCCDVPLSGSDGFNHEHTYTKKDALGQCTQTGVFSHSHCPGFDPGDRPLDHDSQACDNNWLNPDGASGGRTEENAAYYVFSDNVQSDQFKAKFTITAGATGSSPETVGYSSQIGVPYSRASGFFEDAAPFYESKLPDFAAAGLGFEKMMTPASSSTPSAGLSDEIYNAYLGLFSRIGGDVKLVARTALGLKPETTILIPVVEGGREKLYNFSISDFSVAEAKECVITPTDAVARPFACTEVAPGVLGDRILEVGEDNSAPGQAPFEFMRGWLFDKMVFATGTCSTGNPDCSSGGAGSADNSEHTFKLEYSGGAYRLYKDGSPVGPSANSPSRPVQIAIGNPVMAGWGCWPKMSVDYVKVTGPSGTVFEDNFDSLDLSKWSVRAGRDDPGWATTSGGKLLLNNGGNCGDSYTLVTSKVAAFPASGDFSFEFRISYPVVTGYGVYLWANANPSGGPGPGPTPTPTPPGPTGTPTPPGPGGQYTTLAGVKPGIPDCYYLTTGNMCTQRCNYDTACSAVRGGAYPVCGKSEGECLQCYDAAKMDETYGAGCGTSQDCYLGCRPGDVCDSVYNWCMDTLDPSYKGTHYHVEYAGGQWKTLLGDGCDKNLDCYNSGGYAKFNDGWQRRCDIPTGLCMEDCVPGSGSDGEGECSNAAHFGPGWKCSDGTAGKPPRGLCYNPTIGSEVG